MQIEARLRLISTTVVYIFFISALLYCSTVLAHPVQPEIHGLPHSGLLSVFRDHKQPSVFYAIPKTIEFLSSPTGGPRFRIKHWGLSSADWRGAGAIAKFSVRPRLSQRELNDVVNALRSRHSSARIILPDTSDSNVRLIINGSYFERHQNTTRPASGEDSTVFPTQHFSILLNKLGARAFTHDTSNPNYILGFSFAFKMNFLSSERGGFLDAKVGLLLDPIRDFYIKKNIYEITHARWSNYYRFFVDNGWITFDFGPRANRDVLAYKSVIYEKLWGRGQFHARLTRTELKTKLKFRGSLVPDIQRLRVPKVWAGLLESIPYPPDPVPGPSVPDWPPGWPRMGDPFPDWPEEPRHEAWTYLTVSSSRLEERRFEASQSFSVSCPRWSSKFENLSDEEKRCISPEDIRLVAIEVRRCVNIKISWYRMLLRDGLIDQDLLRQRIDDIMNHPCYAIGRETTKAMQQNRRTLEDNRTDLDNGAISQNRWKANADRLSREVILR